MLPRTGSVTDMKSVFLSSYSLLTRQRGPGALIVGKNAATTAHEHRVEEAPDTFFLNHISIRVNFRISKTNRTIVRREILRDL